MKIEILEYYGPDIRYKIGGSGSSNPETLEELKEEYRRKFKELLINSLMRNCFNKTKAAESIGIKRSTFLLHLKRFAPELIDVPNNKKLDQPKKPE